MAFPTTDLFCRYEAKLDTGHSDAEALSTVEDQSANGRDLTSGAGDELTYETNELNGEPVYRANGSESAELTGQSFSSVTAWSMTAVCKADAEGTERHWPFAASDDNLARIMGISQDDTDGEWGNFGRTSTATVQQSTSGVDCTAWSVLTLTWDGADINFYHNGTLVAGPTTLGGTFLGEADGWIVLGRLRSQVNTFFDGDIALAAAWDAALDTTARADLHSYVQDTYGITVSDYTGGGGGGGNLPLLIALGEA